MFLLAEIAYGRSSVIIFGKVNREFGSVLCFKLCDSPGTVTGYHQAWHVYKINSIPYRDVINYLLFIYYLLKLNIYSATLIHAVTNFESIWKKYENNWLQHLVVIVRPIFIVLYRAIVKWLIIYISCAVPLYYPLLFPYFSTWFICKCCSICC